MSQPMVNKPIEKATDAELRDFAELVLGLELATAKTRADVMGLVQQTWQADFIPVAAATLGDNDQEDDAQPVARQEIPLFNRYPDPRFLVIITSTALPGGEEPVPLGCNGDVVVVNRDQEVLIPMRFMDSLINAVRHTLTQDARTQEIKEARFTAYPYQILERPSRAEVEAFKAKSASLLLGGGEALAA